MSLSTWVEMEMQGKTRSVRPRSKGAEGAGAAAALGCREQHPADWPHGSTSHGAVTIMPAS